MKDLSAKAKWKNMRIFHVQLLFHAATESHSNYCAANNNVPTSGTIQFSWWVHIFRETKKQNTTEEKQTLGNKIKQEFTKSVKKGKEKIKTFYFFLSKFHTWKNN